MWGKEVGKALEGLMVMALIGFIFCVLATIGGVGYAIYWLLHHVKIV